MFSPFFGNGFIIDHDFGLLSPCLNKVSRVSFILISPIELLPSGGYIVSKKIFIWCTW